MRSHLKGLGSRLALLLTAAILLSGCQCPVSVDLKNGGHLSKPAPFPSPTPVTCAEVPSERTTFNAFDDFSFLSNPGPDGAWRYGLTPTLGGSFETYAFKSGYYIQNPSYLSLSIWQSRSNQYDPNVMKNENGVDLVSNMNWVYHPIATYLHLHPGPSGEYTIVRWTCPRSGAYRVDSAFRSLRLGGPATTTDIHVLVNDTPVFSGKINGFYVNGEFPYQATLELAACDTVDFAVGYGDNSDYGYDSSGLRASIEQVPSP